MGIWALLSTAISCVFYGILLTVVIMTFLYFVLRLISEGAVKSIPFYITGVFLAMFLSIQLSLMAGAIEANNMVDAVEIFINRMMEGKFGTLGSYDSQQLLDEIVEEYPLLGVYVESCDFSGHDTMDIATVMAEEIHSFLSTYIWHRVWWSLGFIVVACLLALIFDKGHNRTYNSDYTYNSSTYSNPDEF